MSPQILEAVREYEDVRKTKSLLPTVDAIAERHGLTRQTLMYYVGKVEKEGQGTPTPKAS